LSGSKDVKFTNLTRLLLCGYRSFKQIHPPRACINKTEGPQYLFPSIHNGMFTTKNTAANNGQESSLSQM